MTREEEIKNEAKLKCYDIASEVDYKHSAAYDGFVMGAKWSDKHPNKKLVYTKQELMDMGFSFDLNGNICTPQEIEERSKKYINYRKNKWIDKACKWLLKQEEMIGVSFDNDFIERFKKEMDE